MRAIARLSIALFFVSSLLALGAASASDDPPRLPSLLVTGVGSVSRQPDIAVVSMGVGFLEPTASEAQSKVNAAIKSAISAIQELGVQRSSVRTTDLRLEAVYEKNEKTKGDNTDPAPPRLLGYSAEMTLRVNLEDVALAGQVVDAAIKSGVNDLDGIWFGLKDDTRDQEAALDRAVTVAMRKARAIAKAMNVELGEAIEIVENPESRGGGGGVSYFSGPETTVIEPGEVTVEARVEIRYLIAAKR